MTDTKIPNQLRPFIEARRQTGENIRAAVRVVLDDAKQPLSVLEVQRATAQLLERSVDPTHIRIILKELSDAGLVSSRTETDQERLIRANGKSARGYVATLYWAHGGKVPMRTIAEVIPGVALENKPKRGPGRPKGSKNKQKSKPGLASKSPVATDQLSDVLVSVLSPLFARIEELENKLAAIAKIAS